MDKESTERIEKRIAELEQQREQLVVQANQEIAGLNRAIAELKQLLEPELPVPVEVGKETDAN